MKRICSIVFAFAVLALVSIARPARADSASEWCVGGVQISGNVIQCVVDKTLDVSRGARERKGVRSIHIQGTLSADLQKVTQAMEHGRLEVPEQTLQVTLDVSGTPVSLVVKLAPVVTFDRQGDTLVATDVELNVSSIQGNLPAVLTQFAMQEINHSRRIKDAVLLGLNELLAHQP